MKHIILILTLIFTTHATSTFSLAAPELDSTTDMYMRAVWGLVVVGGIMLVIYGLVRKRFSLVGNKEDSKIKLLEMRPIMPKKTLCLVEVEGKQVLLGITADSINHLTTIENGFTASFSEHLAAAENE